jgi:hypothetical protein
MVRFFNHHEVSGFFAGVNPGNLRLFGIAPVYRGFSPGRDGLCGAGQPLY